MSVLTRKTLFFKKEMMGLLGNVEKKVCSFGDSRVIEMVIYF